MKRLILSLFILMWGVLSVKALSYDDACREAWFLTDKMAYELNLTPDQCDIAYQINLDYFLSVRRSSDCRGIYWRFRNDDFRCVFSPWQFNLYITLDYFYYPIRRHRSRWYFPVFDYYRRGYYYFERPVVCISYRGSGWRHRSRRAYSPYRGYSVRNEVGLRDRYHSNGHRPMRHYDSNGHIRPDRDHGVTRPGVGTTDRPGTRPGIRPDGRPGMDNNGRPNRDFGTDRPSRDFGTGRPGKDTNRQNVEQNGSRPNSEQHTVRPDRNNYRPSRDFGSGRPSRDFGNSGTTNRQETRPARKESAPKRENVSYPQRTNEGHRISREVERPKREVQRSTPERSHSTPSRGHQERPERPSRDFGR